MCMDAKLINIMDTILKVSVAPAGFFACLELQSINSAISFVVGIATIIFLVLSIYKIIKDLTKK